MKYNNGFHVTIESVKQTQSVTQIFKKYYRDFLKGQSIEGLEEEDMNDQNNGNGSESKESNGEDCDSNGTRCQCRCKKSKL